MRSDQDSANNSAFSTAAQLLQMAKMRGGGGGGGPVQCILD